MLIKNRNKVKNKSYLKIGVNNYFDYLLAVTGGKAQGCHRALLLNRNRTWSKQLFIKDLDNNSQCWDGLDFYKYSYNHPELNEYISPNCFKSWNGHKSNVLSVCANYLDLDIFEASGHAYTPQSWLKFWHNPIRKMFDYYNRKNKPINKPSIIINTGHGFHLIWLLDQPYYLHKPSFLRKWKKTQKYLAHFINIGCDLFGGGIMPNDYDVSNDPSRVLRLPNSFNNKYDLPRVSCHEIVNNYRIYGFKEMYQNIVVNHTPKSKTSSYGNFKPSKYSKNQAWHFAMIKLHNVLNLLKDKRKDKIMGWRVGHRGKINGRLGKETNSIIFAINGFVQNIKSKNYELLKHRDWAMYYYCCLLVEQEPKITQKQLLSRFDDFVNRILKPKCYIPKNDIIKIKTEIRTQYKINGKWGYKAYYSHINHNMGFNRLWKTKAQRRFEAHSAKNRRMRDLKHRVVKLSRTIHNKAQIAKILHVGRSTVYRYLRHRN